MSIIYQPDYAQAHNNLGFVLEREGKLEKAISHYSKALEINPDYPDVKNNLARAQRSLKLKTK